MGNEQVRSGPHLSTLCPATGSSSQLSTTQALGCGSAGHSSTDPTAPRRGQPPGSPTPAPTRPPHSSTPGARPACGLRSPHSGLGSPHKRRRVHLPCASVTVSLTLQAPTRVQGLTPVITLSPHGSRCLSFPDGAQSARPAKLPQSGLRLPLRPRPSPCPTLPPPRLPEDTPRSLPAQRLSC